MKFSCDYYKYNPDKKPSSGNPLASPFECYDKEQADIECEDVEAFFDKLMDLDKQFCLPTVEVGRYIICADLGKIYVRKRK